MAGVFCDEGLYLPVLLMLGDTTSGKPPATLRLFTNDFTPSESSVYSSFTEMTGRGYLIRTLAGTTWSWLLDGSGHLTTGTYEVPVWNFTEGTATTIYGYYITNTDAGSNHRVIEAERWSAPFALGIGATSLTVTLTRVFKLGP